MNGRTYEKPILDKTCLIWDRLSDVKQVLVNIDIRIVGEKLDKQIWKSPEYL